MAKDTEPNRSGLVYLTLKNDGFTSLTTAVQPAGIAVGRSSGWAPVTVALIRALASATEVGVGDTADCPGTGLGENLETGEVVVPHALDSAIAETATAASARQ